MMDAAKRFSIDLSEIADSEHGLKLTGATVVN